MDDAVIDVENTLRRLRENRLQEQSLPALRVVFDASLEVRGAVVDATFAVVLVFVPILTMTCAAGRVFAPLAMAYIFALLPCLAVALTVTPALCSLLLGGERFPAAEPPVVGWLRARHGPLLRVERHLRAVTSAVAVLTLGSLAVLHDGARWVQAVTCSVVGRGVTAFLADARRRLAAAEARVGILIMLAVVMGSPANFLLVLAKLPFALVGGVVVVLLGGGELSLGLTVGFVTVFGITLRNSIMLVAHHEHLVNAEGASWGLETALRGAEERLAPILMTAQVTALGLLPMAAGSGAPGREIEGTMPLVILGGLATSTVLDLLLLPTPALRFGRFGPRPSLDLA